MKFLSTHRNRILPLFAPLLGGLLAVLLLGALHHYVQAAVPPLPSEKHPAAPLDSDLSISVQASVQAARPGEVYSYTIVYSNTTGQTINNVAITATVSDKQIWDGAYQATPPLSDFSSSGDPEHGYTLIWQVGTLAAGAQGSIIFNVQAITTTEPNSDRGIIFLGTTAIIASPQSGVTGEQADDVLTMVGPLLEISKVAAPRTVRPGHLAVYTLTVENIARMDSIPATNLVISDIIPEYSTLYKASDSGYYTPTWGRVRWEWAGPLNPGESKVLTFSVRIKPTAPPRTEIRNRRTEYFVTSSELLFGPLEGERDANIRTLSLLEKTAVSADTSSGTPRVYPGDLITYTLTVYNPLSVTMSGVILTDTLPGTPMPFTYLAPVTGSVPPDGITPDGRTLTWTLDLPPWGAASRAFVVQIPRHVEIPPNRIESTYNNALDAFHPDMEFFPETRLAPVKVAAAVTMDKETSINHVMDGESVVYTITLESHVDFSVTNIILTDTLEGQFRFIRMVSGPQPEAGYRSNPIVWQGLTLLPHEEMEIAFEARVKGDWLETYRNSLDAASPDAFIPSRSRIAPVRVDPPLGINKGVAPQEVFIGDNVNYVITITNLSTVPFTLEDSVSDQLYPGLYQVGGDNPGGNPAVINLSDPVVLQPEESWFGHFTAFVSLDVSCRGLPRSVPNARGSIRAHVTSPLNVYVVNATNLAPFTLKPNIEVDLISDHTRVLRGEIFTYTLHLLNVSPVSAPDSTVELTFKPDIHYLQTVSGPPPNTSGDTLTWNNLTIPANSEVTIVFQMQVSNTASRGDKTPTFSGDAYGVCFGRLGDGPQPKGDGKVTVVDTALVLYKRAEDTEVPPLAQVRYEIWLENQLDYEYTLQSLTDTLPPGFTYLLMDSGPEPDEYDTEHIVWNSLTIPPGKTLLKLRLLASPLYGTFDNRIAGYIDPPYTIVVDTDRNPRDGAPDARVTVMPIFDLSKAASQDEALPNTTLAYTITMVNLSDVDYSGVRLTDTLPAGFTYYRTLQGPVPASISADKRTVVWDNLNVKGNCRPGQAESCTQEVIFEAHIEAWVEEGVHYNTLEGHSASGAIPGPISTAPVTITQSLGYDIFLPCVLK